MISSLDKEEGWPMGPRHQPAVYELQFGGRNIPGKNHGRKPAALSATSKSSVSVRASHLVCGNAAAIARSSHHNSRLRRARADEQDLDQRRLGVDGVTLLDVRWLCRKHHRQEHARSYVSDQSKPASNNRN
jgi:hypothetical protein